MGAGGFVVVWQDTSNAAETGTDVRGQIYDAAGNKVGGEVTVTSTVAGEQILPIVRATESGGFIVTWSDNSGAGGDASGYGVKAQLFDSTGATIGGEFVLNTTTSGDQRQSELAALGDDRYVAGWTDHSASADDPASRRSRRIFKALRGGSGKRRRHPAPTRYDPPQARHRSRHRRRGKDSSITAAVDNLDESRRPPAPNPVLKGDFGTST